MKKFFVTVVSFLFFWTLIGITVTKSMFPGIDPSDLVTIMFSSAVFAGIADAVARFINGDL